MSNPTTAEVAELARRLRLPYLRRAADDVLATAKAQRYAGQLENLIAIAQHHALHMAVATRPDGIAGKQDSPRIQPDEHHLAAIRSARNLTERVGRRRHHLDSTLIAGRPAAEGRSRQIMPPSHTVEPVAPEPARHDSPSI